MHLNSMYETKAQRSGLSFVRLSPNRAIAPNVRHNSLSEPMITVMSEWYNTNILFYC